MSFLGLDVGTTGCKGIALSDDGTVIASAYREYPLHSPQPGWEELDPEAVWGHIREVIQETARAAAAARIDAGLGLIPHLGDDAGAAAG